MDTDASASLAGFCGCDEANGHYQYFPDFSNTAVPEDSDTDSPCAYAAFIPGQDGDDECWGPGNPVDTLYLSEAALQTDVPGCKKDATTGFAVCDTTTGWYMPDDGTGAPDTAWGGLCMPACYLSG